LLLKEARENMPLDEPNAPRTMRQSNAAYEYCLFTSRVWREFVVRTITSLCLFEF